MLTDAAPRLVRPNAADLRQRKDQAVIRLLQAKRTAKDAALDGDREKARDLLLDVLVEVHLIDAIDGKLQTMAVMRAA